MGNINNWNNEDYSEANNVQVIYINFTWNCNGKFGMERKQFWENWVVNNGIFFQKKNIRYGIELEAFQFYKCKSVNFFYCEKNK